MFMEEISRWQHPRQGEAFRVLDIGCGTGDVTLLTAEMLGAEGHVVGIDRGDDALEAARARAASASRTKPTAMTATNRVRLSFDGPLRRVILGVGPFPASPVRYRRSTPHVP